MRPGSLAPLVIAVMACVAAPAVAQTPAAPWPWPMIGGGEVTLRQDGDDLRVTVIGPRAGLASLCVGDESRVRILHASAAVGEALYERAERIRYLGVTYLATDEPMALSHWPASLDDGCREMKVAQGYLPDTAQFRPAGWHRLK